MTNTTVLVTGANRGIGLAIAQQYLKQASTTVIATVRSASKADALHASPIGSGSKLVVVTLSSDDDKSPHAAIEQAQKEHGITAIDTVIVNAGYAVFSTLSKAQAADFREELQTNVVLPMLIYQATASLLRKSANPKFVVISSAAGSITVTPNYATMTNGTYSASKAAVNLLVRKIAYEAPIDKDPFVNLNAFVVHPGLVLSDMGHEAMAKMGFTVEDAAAMGAEVLSPEQSGVAVHKLVEGATREKFNGEFWSYNGDTIPW